MNELVGLLAARTGKVLARTMIDRDRVFGSNRQQIGKAATLGASDEAPHGGGEAEGPLGIFEAGRSVGILDLRDLA